MYSLYVYSTGDGHIYSANSLPRFYKSCIRIWVGDSGRLMTDKMERETNGSDPWEVRDGKVLRPDDGPHRVDEEAEGGEEGGFEVA